MKKLFGFVLAFILMVNYLTFAGVLQTQAQEFEQFEENVEAAELTDVKFYCDATLEDEFPEKIILITLTKEASVANLLYSAEDFSEMFGVEIVEAEPLLYFEKRWWSPCQLGKLQANVYVNYCRTWKTSGVRHYQNH